MCTLITNSYVLYLYSETCLQRSLKGDKKMSLKTGGRNAGSTFHTSQLPSILIYQGVHCCTKVCNLLYYGL